MKKAFSILLIVFSAMMLIHCAYADITESLIYDEADNTWAAGDEDLTELVSIMKRECTRSPSIPRAKARKAEGRGMYRRKTPMVPKISMEAINMPSDLRSFVFFMAKYRFCIKRRTVIKPVPGSPRRNPRRSEWRDL